MPHTKSAWKRLRQTEKRRARNRAAAKALRKVTRDLADAVEGTDTAATATAHKAVVAKLDKAAARNIIHKNKAARLKSRMAKKLNAAAAKAK